MIDLLKSIFMVAYDVDISLVAKKALLELWKLKCEVRIKRKKKQEEAEQSYLWILCKYLM